MRASMSIPLWGLLLFLTSCTQVTSPIPIGQPIIDDDDSVDYFNGVWTTNDSSEVIHLRHAGQGVLKAAHLGWDDEKKLFELMQLHAVVSRHDDIVFLNLRNAKGEPSEYLFRKCQMIDGQNLLLWHPDFDQFKTAVLEDRIVGTIIKNDEGEAHEVKLAEDQEKLLAFIKATPSAFIGPQLMQRVSKLEKDPPEP